MAEHSNIPKQFLENLGIISTDDYNRLVESKVLIIGLGGLGGNVANGLIRLGVHNFTLVDYDSFELSNLNRQLFSNTLNVGLKKVEIVKEELLKINPSCNINTSISKIQDIAVSEIDYIIDAVDNPATKIYISKLGTKLNVPVLHGACAGWYGQVGWVLPGNDLIENLYGEEEHGLEKELKNPSFAPSAVSAIMVSEFLKLIKGSDNTTINQILLIDLFNNSMLKTGKSND